MSKLRIKGPCQPGSNFQKGTTIKTLDTGKVLAALTREGEKHVAFIVEAVNEYETLRQRIENYEAMEYPRLKVLNDELVEALKRIIKNWDDEFTIDDSHPYNKETWRLVQAALAKAGAA